MIRAESGAEGDAVEETGASLVVSDVAAGWLLVEVADDEADADASAVEVAVDDGAAVEVCAGAADDAAPVLPASGTSSCLPASGSVPRPHFSPALLRVPP